MNAETKIIFSPTTIDSSISTIILPKRFSATNAIFLQQEIEQLLQTNKNIRNITIDCLNNQFIDSSGIGALVKCFKLCKDNNIQLNLSNTRAQITAVLEMTGLDKLLVIEQNNNQENKAALPATHPSIRCRSKRLIDIFGSLTGLLITAVLFIPISIAIKIESSGPIFFSQTRMGWLGSRFKIFKFRTMVVDAEEKKHEIKNEAQGAIFKCADDPRITRVGKFLRKTSLDEFPQFLNVLTGSMSLVGTRPPTPDEIAQYHVPHWQRLDVKPGITGEWQVNGRSKVKNFEDIIQLDLDYQKKWSLAYDIKLILKTIIVIFSKKSGAM